MKIIPFRIKPSKEEDNFSDVYAFLIKGSHKNAYEVEIDIDSLNDLGITEVRCTCPHNQFRALECKHIQKAIEILKEFEIDLGITDKVDYELMAKVASDMSKGIDPVTPNLNNTSEADND